MRTITAAAALAGGLAAGAAAQEGRSMDRGLSMLEASAGGVLRRHGVEADPTSLSLNQIARLLELRSRGDDGDGRLSASQVEALLRERRSFSPGD